MSEPVDPFDLLRRLNPVEPEDVADAASAVEAQRALEEILAGKRKPPPHRRTLRRRPTPARRRRHLLAAIPLAGALAAAAAWALTLGPNKQLTIGCYATANLQAHTVVVSAGRGSPTATCRRAWGAAVFGNRSAPPLEACVLPSGGIGVFPSLGGRVCQRLKLQPLAQTTGTNPSATLDLKHALVRLFLRTCLNEQQAMATVRDQLLRLKLTDWQVRSNGEFTSGRPCASPAFDEQNHLVLVVPIPR